MSDKPHVNIPHTGCSSDAWCKHYAGFSSHKLEKKTHCKAGVEYATVATAVEFTYSRGDEKHRYTKTVAHPCFKYESPLTKGCAKCQFRTPEEISAERAEMDAEFKQAMVARDAILEDLQRRGKAKDPNVHALNPDDEYRWIKPQRHYYSGSGLIDCPVCKTGKLSYSRSGYNGHVRAACSTATCVRWME